MVFLEEFFNCSKDLLISEKNNGKLDDGMYEICMFFRNNGYKSALSCSSHGSRLAYIKFCTGVEYEELYRFCSTIPVKYGYCYVGISGALTMLK